MDIENKDTVRSNDGCEAEVERKKDGMNVLRMCTPCVRERTRKRKKERRRFD